MNIMVCVKQVPDNAVVPKLDPSTGKVMTQGVETMVSPFDLNAIEAGLTLASEHGGEVSVITAGDDWERSKLIWSAIPLWRTPTPGPLPTPWPKPLRPSAPSM